MLWKEPCPSCGWYLFMNYFLVIYNRFRIFVLRADQNCCVTSQCLRCRAGYFAVHILFFSMCSVFRCETVAEFATVSANSVCHFCHLAHLVHLKSC